MDQQPVFDTKVGLATVAISVLLAIAIEPSIASAQGQDRYWTNTNSPLPFFQDSGNWLAGLTPSNIDTAVFDRTNGTLSYDVWWNPTTQVLQPSVGALRISDSALSVAFQSISPSIHELKINGVGGNLRIENFGYLSLSGIHLNSVSGGAYIKPQGELYLNDSHGMGSMLTINQSSFQDVFRIEGHFAAVSNSSQTVGSKITTGFAEIVRTDPDPNSVSSGFAELYGPKTTWDYSGGLAIGSDTETGKLNVSSGAKLNHIGDTREIIQGNGKDDASYVVVRDSGSEWNAGSISIGDRYGAQMSVDDGALVTANQLVIGSDRGEYDPDFGLVAVFRNAELSVANLIVGNAGKGTLNIDGGNATSGIANLGVYKDSSGTANIDNGEWDIATNLQIGGAGEGDIRIGKGGLVRVGVATAIGDLGSVSLSGGRLEFGTTTDPQLLARTSGTSGSLSGFIFHSGDTDVSPLGGQHNGAIDLGEVRLVNSGRLYGSGDLGSQLINESAGEVETSSTDRMRWTGEANTNAGQINVFGGQLRFTKDFTNQSEGLVNNFGATLIADQITNQAGGLIQGHGQFVGSSFFTNEGLLALSGTSDIVGDFFNAAGGRVLISGKGTTTFYDDVVHNGTEIRTSAGNSVVFLGELTGSGSFTGAGSVFMEGDLRPGNSPGSVLFEGDLTLGQQARTLIELGGLNAGEFDQILVNGTLDLNDSSLMVSLWDGFKLQSGMEFLFANVGGSLLGDYHGLGEGSRVGNFGGRELFITYAAGNGNDIALFTAVPEPSGVALLAIFGSIGLFAGRRRTNDCKCPF